MALIDQLNSASFRGVPFLIDGNDIESGRKIVVHEFPNKDERFVEDLGALLKTFRVRGIISDPNYKLNRDALINALETPGIGTLIHPLYGNIEVTPEPYRLVEDMNSLGIATFEMVFKESTKNIFPGQAANNQSFVEQLGLDTALAAQNNFAKKWRVGRHFKNNFVQSQYYLNRLGGFFSGVQKPFTATAPGLNKYNLSVTNYNNSLPSSVTNGAALAGSIGDVFTNLNGITEEPRGQFYLSKSFFTYGNGVILPQPTTLQRQQLITNINALNEQINISSLSNAYTNATQIAFSNEDDLNFIESTLDNQFFYTTDTFNIDPATLDLLKNLRNQARIYFDQARLDVKRLTEIFTEQVTITTLTYAYYNALDNDFLLLDINKAYTPNNIQGNFTVVTES